MFSNLKDTPIQRKLMSVMLLTSSFVLVLMCGAYLVFEYYSFKSNIKNDVSTLGIVIAANSSAALAFDSQQDATEILGALKANAHIVSACLYDESGRQFARYPSTISAQDVPGKPQKSGYRFESGYLIGYQPVLQNNERMGTLFIKCDLDAMNDQILRFLLVGCVLIVISLFAAYLVSQTLQRAISAPILALEQTANMISKDQNYAIRAVKTGKDEIGSLTDAFNHMLSRLEKQNLEIMESEEASSKLAAIVETSNDAIIGQTLDGVITSWNKSAERMFGYTADEMIGQPISKMAPAERADENKGILARLSKGERIENFETERVDKYNKLFYVSITVSIVRDSLGNTIGVSKIVRDITEKKQEEIRKNDFIAIVSHELKTPLTSIKAYLQLLLGIAKKEQASFSINALSKAEGQVKKMTSMVQDFLSLARLEGGNIQINKVPFELQLLMQEVVDEAMMLNTQHKLIYNNCGSIIVNGDRDKIGQVLINLLSNAVKYDPDGGEIIVSCDQTDGKVRISITDHGVGISEKDQASLFDRFYRVRNEKVKTVSGFGIGLYLVATIVGYHNSSIKVRSSEGAGSTFYFDLDVIGS